MNKNNNYVIVKHEMYKKLRILAVIPARGGSKRLPGKNIKKLLGKPLIAYAIEAAKKSKHIDWVLVSTDDLRIAKVAKKHGAEVPFLRPAKLATDTALTLPVVQHAVKYVEENDVNKKIDLIVLMQPTSPLVLSEDIDLAIEKLVRTNSNSCISVSEVSERPEWMQVFSGQKIMPLIKTKLEETRRSQDLKRLFIINGAVYVIRRDTLMDKNHILDKNSTAIIMPKERSVDIDEAVDFKIAEAIMSDKSRTK